MFCEALCQGAEEVLQVYQRNLRCRWWWWCCPYCANQSSGAIWHCHMSQEDSTCPTGVYWGIFPSTAAWIYFSVKFHSMLQRIWVTIILFIIPLSCHNYFQVCFFFSSLSTRNKYFHQHVSCVGQDWEGRDGRVIKETNLFLFISWGLLLCRNQNIIVLSDEQK